MSTSHRIRQFSIAEESERLRKAAMSGQVDVVVEILTSPHLHSKDLHFLVEQKDCWHDSILNSAAFNGHIEVVKFLVGEIEMDVENRGYKGRTPLLQACTNGGNFETVRYLVDEGHADIDAEDIDGWKAIHLAASWGNVNAVHYLLEQNALNSVSQNATIDFCGCYGGTITMPNYSLLEARSRKYGLTPLLHAAASGNLPVLHYLIEVRRANIDAEDNSDQGSKAIHLAAAFCNNVEAVNYLLDKRPDWLEARSRKYGRTPLMYAVGEDNLANVRFLIERKHANVDAEDWWDGMLAIHSAAYCGFADIVVYLLEVKPDLIGAKSRKHGRTPLLHAVEGGSLPVVRYLIEVKGADIDAEDNHKAKAIHLAAQFGRVDVVGYLLDKKPEWLEVKDGKHGRTPFLFGAQQGHLPVVFYLAESKEANFDAEDNGGMNALHLAAKWGNVNTAGYLLGKRPQWLEISSRKYSKTPLLHAIEGSNLSVIRFLTESKRANLGVEQGAEGLKVIHVAAECSDVATVSYLLNIKPNWLEILTSKQGRTPFLHASASGNLPVVAYLLETTKANIEAEDNEGFKAIHLVAKWSNVDTVSYLLKRLPTWLEIRSRQCGKTPLLSAAESGNLAVLRFLVENKKANIDAADETGMKAIHLAAGFGHPNTCAYLLDRRPDFLEMTAAGNGFTPLKFAIENKKRDVITLLISRGAKVDDPSEYNLLAFQADKD